MSHPDLNLLIALDVLLAEASVARAARRLRLSPSAMSRTLSRLRKTVGDPLLVRAGGGLVPTPRALELRERTGRVVDEARALLRPEAAIELAQLRRTFALRTSDGFVEGFGAALITRLASEATGVRLHFLPKPDKEGTALREGACDLETGVVDPQTSPDLRAQMLFRDRFVGVVRAGHPLAEGEVTAARFAAGRHVAIVRRGLDKGPAGTALAPLGREIVALVGGFSAALALARHTDLIATVPDRHTEGLRAGMVSFPLPVAVAEVTVSMLWHPRLDADPAHRWLRACLREVCAAAR
ncbi:MAG TPA: LysR family transcriptional regulator [Xanthobacteraceae bacterium]|nr:LysR family transcriptional regulator [Xanthobacteraceae bacterium]